MHFDEVDVTKILAQLPRDATNFAPLREDKNKMRTLMHFQDNSWLQHAYSYLY
jgi:hypothetical protein